MSAWGALLPARWAARRRLGSGMRSAISGMQCQAALRRPGLQTAVRGMQCPAVPEVAREQPWAPSCGLPAAAFNGRLIAATGSSIRVWVFGVAHHQTTCRSQSCGC